jgi:MFS family permease
MQNVALSWLVYRLTGSVFLLGFIGFTSQIPAFVLTPFTGVLTDRYSKLRIMTLSQCGFMIQALTMTLLVLFNVIAVWHIIFLSLISGIISALDAPARQSLVVELLDDQRDLGNAIALNSAVFNGARLVGPAIAGLIIAATGEGICFLLNTLSFVAVIVALRAIKIPHRKPVARSVTFRENFLEGFRYTFRTYPIRTLIILLAILSLFGIAYIVLLPAYASKVLHGGSETLGYLMSAMGAGALSATLYMASRKTVTGLAKLLSFSVILLGLMLLTASFSGNFFFSILLFFFGGIAMILSLSSINIMIQTITEEDKRGRVMSFYAMALMGTTPIGNLIAGSVASKVGIAEALMICGILTIITGTWFALNCNSFQKFMHPAYPVSIIRPDLPGDVR